MSHGNHVTTRRHDPGDDSPVCIVSDNVATESDPAGFSTVGFVLQGFRMSNTGKGKKINFAIVTQII
jgi:hypothetical protein